MSAGAIDIFSLMCSFSLENIAEVEDETTYEDSSSVSSGISENIDEISTDDLTGSSLSDQAFTSASVGQIKPQKSGSNKSNLQQVSQKSTGVSTRKLNAEQQTENGINNGSSNGLKKTFEQEQFNIDQLLLKCRSTTRGLGCSGYNSPQLSQQTRPKSEQMNGTAAFSPRQFAIAFEGDPLRWNPSRNYQINEKQNGRKISAGVLTSQNGCGLNGHLQNPLMNAASDSQVPHNMAANFGFRRAPLTNNTLQLLKTDGTNGCTNGAVPSGSLLSMMPGAPETLPRPASASGHRSQGNLMSGYHSLDRKKYFYSQLNNQNAISVSNGTNEEINDSINGSLLNNCVLRSGADGISPRSVVGNSSLGLYHNGCELKQSGGTALSLPMNCDKSAASENWMRHSVGGSTMSRSMIEQQELKLSPINGGPHPTVASVKLNGNLRLTIPPSMQRCNGMSCNSNQESNIRQPKTGHTKNVATESPYVNFGFGIQRLNGEQELISPTSQLQLHKLSCSSMSTHSEPAGLSPTSKSAPVGRVPHGMTYASPYLCSMMTKVGVGEEEVNGSSLSLASSASSIYSSADDRYQAEIKRLHREVENYKEKVQLLTNQQCTYAHVVAAFEQSLNSMKHRIMSLTSASEQKDSELLDVKEKFDTLRQISATAGINVDHVFSPNVQRRHTFNSQNDSNSLGRQSSNESMNSIQSGPSQRSSMISTTTTVSAGEKNKEDKKGHKKSWGPNKETFQLRSSFTKAFTRSKKNNKNGSISDVEEGSLSSNPCSPSNTPRNVQNLKPANSSSALNNPDGKEDVVTVLQNQLHEKDSVLTDIRLDALKSAHEVDELREAITKLKNENVHLRHHNERLRVAANQHSRASSQNSLPLFAQNDDTESISEGNVLSDMSAPACVDMMLSDGHEGHRIIIAVNLGFHGNMSKFLCDSISINGEILIGSVSVSRSIKWDLIDNIVLKLFKEYVLRVDPISNLNLSIESIVGYAVGNVIRSKDKPPPIESLTSCLSNNNSTVIKITLKGVQQAAVDAVAFETLVPKALIQRYINLLLEHRRIILCGSCGTGKSYLAHKLGEYLVLKNEKTITPGSIATFSVDNKSSRDLSQYLATIASQCEQANGNDEIPSVIILDNLHNVQSLADVFNGFLSSRHTKCPYIIGTMNQPTGSTTNLQLHHNFRWVLLGNHMDPVKGYLSRYLRRRLIEVEVKQNAKYPVALQQILDWLSKVWTQLNKFIEAVSCSDVTIGPRLFLSCPLDVDQARDWFIELWNHSVIPYLLEAGREGLQLYGKRSSWEDPTEFVAETWPWTEGDDPEAILLKIRAEDLGCCDINPPSLNLASSRNASGDSDGDSLLSMLMRLRQTTNKTSSSDSNGTDSRSLHSNAAMKGVESTL